MIQLSTTGPIRFS